MAIACTHSELLSSAARRALSYLDGLETRGVAPTAEALHNLNRLGGPLPESGEHAADVLALLDEVGSPATTASAGPRYFGFVIGGALPETVAASWLASAWDQNAGLVAASPVSAALEEVSLAWLLALLKLPATAGGAFVTGATMANFTSLAAARHAVLNRVGWDVEADGLVGARPSR
jgi:glutamate/tyrosine decarboxylase-like PLP-dependent enzyme